MALAQRSHAPRAPDFLKASCFFQGLAGHATCREHHLVSLISPHATMHCDRRAWLSHMRPPDVWAHPATMAPTSSARRWAWTSAP